MTDEHFSAWLAGFFEGDGSVNYRYKFDNKNRYANVQFSQKDKRVLEYIESVFGGRFYQHKTSSVWYLTYDGRRGSPVLNVLAPCIVGSVMFEALSAVRSILGLPEILTHKPSLDWFVGFWDAEGSSSYEDYALHLDVSQNDKSLLERIRDELPFGGSIYPNGSCY